jgi:DNA-directed RNA polymerase specialized sigma24 family protein
LKGLVSPDEWHLISRAYVDRATREEMAAELGITPGALRVRLSRAARSFRNALQRADQFGAKDD